MFKILAQNLGGQTLLTGGDGYQSQKDGLVGKKLNGFFKVF